MTILYVVISNAANSEVLEGYDPAPIFESVDHPNFGALRLVPWRIELVNFPGMPLVWHNNSTESKG